MFPRRLAEGPFSLRAGFDTPTLAISAELAPDGALARAAIAPATARVAARLSYGQVDAAIAAGGLAQLAPGLPELLRVSPRASCITRLLASADAAANVQCRGARHCVQWCA